MNRDEGSYWLSHVWDKFLLTENRYCNSVVMKASDVRLKHRLTVWFGCKCRCSRPMGWFMVTLTLRRELFVHRTFTFMATCCTSVTTWRTASRCSASCLHNRPVLSRAKRLVGATWFYHTDMLFVPSVLLYCSSMQFAQLLFWWFIFVIYNNRFTALCPVPEEIFTHSHLSWWSTVSPSY